MAGRSFQARIGWISFNLSSSSFDRGRAEMARRPETPQLRLALEGDLTRRRKTELLREIARELGHRHVTAEFATGPAEPGTRGDGGLVSELLIILAEGGAAILVECLKAYLTREPKVKIMVSGADGAAVTTVASDSDIEVVLPALRDHEARD